LVRAVFAALHRRPDAYRIKNHLLARADRLSSIETVRVATFTQPLQNEESLSPLAWRQRRASAKA
jgi:hypothetical protein